MQANWAIQDDSIYFKNKYDTTLDSSKWAVENLPEMLAMLTTKIAELVRGRNFCTCNSVQVWALGTVAAVVALFPVTDRSTLSKMPDNHYG